MEGTRGPAGAPLARAYEELLRRFGPGTFNGFLHLLPPEHVSTYGGRLEQPGDPVLARHAVFADSENGDALSWDLDAGEGSSVFRFAPRSVEPERVAGSADALLDVLARKNLSFDHGPLRPYFVARDGRERRPLRMRGERPAPEELDAWLARLKEAGTELLDRSCAVDWLVVVVYVPPCDALVRVQHTGVADGAWTFAFNAPLGTPAQAFRPFLLSGTPLGWTAEHDATVVPR
jgi:hypothetical protein